MWVLLGYLAKRECIVIVEMSNNSFCVEFGAGGIGCVLNYSCDGEIVVVGLISGGQAELSKKVNVGDKVVAIDGIRVCSLKELVRCVGGRAVRITFVRSELRDVESQGEIPMFINVDDYKSESECSSSVEIDPMVELSDFADD